MLRQLVIAFIVSLAFSVFQSFIWLVIILSRSFLCRYRGECDESDWVNWLGGGELLGVLFFFLPYGL